MKNLQIERTGHAIIRLIIPPSNTLALNFTPWGSNPHQLHHAGVHPSVHEARCIENESLYPRALPVASYVELS